MSNKEVAVSIPDINGLLHIIEEHSDKGKEDCDIRCSILKDADILDEIGAMSIFMTAYNVDRSSPWFFNLLSKRLKEFEIKFCDKQLNTLHTDMAKKILIQKKEFIQAFIDELDFEIEGTDTLMNI